jgi:Secretion system C-terminal sorting domain
MVNVNNIVPGSYALFQNYPNPFNPATRIKFAIPNAGLTTIKIYSQLGTEVSTLVNEELSAGTYEADFDGRNFASGIYFYVMKTESFTDTKRMILIK